MDRAFVVLHLDNRMALLDPLHKGLAIDFLESILRSWKAGEYDSELYRLDYPKGKVETRNGKIALDRNGNAVVGHVGGLCGSVNAAEPV